MKPNTENNMCKPYEFILRLVSTWQVILKGEKGILAILIAVLLAGCCSAVYIYIDFKHFLAEQTKNQAIQTEVLRVIDQRLTNLERNYYQRIEKGNTPLR